MSDSSDDQLKALYSQLNQQHEQHRTELLARLSPPGSDELTCLSASPAGCHIDLHPTLPKHRSISWRTCRWPSRLSLTVATLIIISLGLLLIKDMGVSRVAYADVIAHFDRKFTYEVTVTLPGMPDSVEYRFNVEKDSHTGQIDPSHREIGIESPGGTHRAILDSHGKQIGGSFQPHDEQALAQQDQKATALHPNSVVGTTQPNAEELAARTNWVNVLRRSAGTERTLGQKKIANTEVIGFEVEFNDSEFRLWAERETGLPVAVEIVASYLPGPLQLTQFSFD